MGAATRVSIAAERTLALLPSNGGTGPSRWQIASRAEKVHGNSLLASRPRAAHRRDRPRCVDAWGASGNGTSNAWVSTPKPCRCERSRGSRPRGRRPRGPAVPASGPPRNRRRRAPCTPASVHPSRRVWHPMSSASDESFTKTQFVRYASQNRVSTAVIFMCIAFGSGKAGCRVPAWAAGVGGFARGRGVRCAKKHRPEDATRAGAEEEEDAEPSCRRVAVEGNPPGRWLPVAAVVS